MTKFEKDIENLLLKDEIFNSKKFNDEIIKCDIVKSEPIPKPKKKEKKWMNTLKK